MASEEEQPQELSPEQETESKSSKGKKKKGASAHPDVKDQKTKEELLKAIYGYRTEVAEEKKKEHKFWSTQPVPALDESVNDHGPIDAPKTVSEVQQEPYALPKGYEWVDCDLTDEKTVDEVYTLLSQNYVEDEDNMFRFDYSRDFLRWALLAPGFRQDWHVAVRVISNKKLVGFITAIPAHVRAFASELPMVEINFLCVHKKLRSLRLAPVLIKEITRRVNLQNIWQAVYTAGVVLPRPVARNRYYHRSLNPKKLVEIGFSRLMQRMTLSRLIKLYKLPEQPQVPGIRPLEERDLPAARALLNDYLNRFRLVCIFSEAEFKHWFTPRPGVISTYVVEDPQTHEITDMCSFYALPSTVIGNKKYDHLKAAYSFYNVANRTPWKVLMNDALILAHNEQFDVFNALNVMENETFFKDLKFGIGDGNLQYYLYNWRCPEMQPSDVGLVLL
eukprot:TRINITY_DN3544_c0_g1_i1.p1 TRINITY_DN3544_c0_g1~~TRINITY_DN3544_c0_g1_i1.p1  ORF type:complete len:467 (-),score=153.07 TRINITY_DN3544_c0_g1_i1:186-1526(-)